MKKIISLALVMVVSLGLFASCGKAEEELPAATVPETALSVSDPVAETITDSEESLPKYPYLIVNSEPYTVTEKEGFDNSGFTVLVCGDSNTYSFKSSSPDVNWDVYLLDNEFDDALRFLPQANEASLSGDGILDITEGQLIYIQCSLNAFTSDEAGDSFLEITTV